MAIVDSADTTLPLRCPIGDEAVGINSAIDYKRADFSLMGDKLCDRHGSITFLLDSYIAA